MPIDELSKHVRIATPCTASWDEMIGDDKVRYCGQCHLSVYNSVAMTDEEVLRTVSGIAQGKRVCMRVYRRQDGTILTKDCPVGLRKLQERLRRAAALLVGGLSVFMALPVFAQRTHGTVCQTVQTSATEGNSDAGKKPVWHSKIKASGNGARSAQKSGATNTPPANIPMNTPALLGDVAISPEYSLQLMRRRVQETERLHGVNSTNTAEALTTLQTELAMQGTAASLSEADSIARRAVRIFIGAKQYLAAQAVCETQLQAARKAGSTSIGYWQTHHDEVAKLEKARQQRQQQSSPDKLDPLSK